MPTEIPEHPYQCIGADNCEKQDQHYLVVVDYHSRYIDIWHLKDMTSAQTIFQLRTMFAKWGIPDGVVSDNGTQFSSLKFRVFAVTYGFTHVISSPHFLQANSQGERAVQTAKRILSREDPFLSLMAYRSTPVVPKGINPCQLIMERQPNTRGSTLDANLHPNWPDGAAVHESDRRANATYKDNFNSRHGARPLAPLQPGGNVLIKPDGQKTRSTPAVVKDTNVAPRSYMVQTSGGVGSTDATGAI